VALVTAPASVLKKSQNRVMKQFIKCDLSNDKGNLCGSADTYPAPDSWFPMHLD
jgi:hypothetical protein